jgi:flagellar biosynthesis/type III secretory pathway protein FliH
LEEGQRAAADAVRRFLDTVESTIPRRDGTLNRQEIVDSALEMAQRLIQTQYDILRRVVQSAGRTAKRS